MGESETSEEKGIGLDVGSGISEVSDAGTGISEVSELLK